MKSENVHPDHAWAHAWFDSVVSGAGTMSQRKLTSIAKHGGGIETVKRLARARNVHLLLLEDDKGDKLVAASLKPFEVIC